MRGFWRDSNRRHEALPRDHRHTSGAGSRLVSVRPRIARSTETPGGRVESAAQGAVIGTRPERDRGSCASAAACAVN
jgi:hypothetical protein